MPLYERRKNGKVIEKVRTVRNSFEDNRIGLIVNAGGKLSDRPGESWHQVDETKPATKQDSTDSGG